MSREWLRGVASALAFASLMLALSPARAIQWQPVGGLDRAHRDAAATILDEAASRLPGAWAEALDGPMRVEWRDDLPGRVDGRYVGGGVVLRRRLLDDWMATRSPTAHRALLSAVLHELAHAWDRSPRGGLSHDPRLLDLAGWQVSAFAAGGRLSTNDFRDRTPDAYELTRPAEFVAVNLEHFLLDPDYACRRPALHRWLAARSGATVRTAGCDAPAFARPSTDGSADSRTLLALDPDRVYAVDYLLAEPGARPMSRWGHSMLRLVICAPGRTPGPDCRLDIAWHEVLSFRAFVDDVQISSWRGLHGGYPSRLFVLPMPQVIEEYTKVELRGLRAVPLSLSRVEIESLLDRAAQVHWTYDGRYRFVSRNCAVETFRLLHDGVPRLAAHDLASLTPTGLLRRLERAGIADPAPLRDADAAQRQGYRFDSMDTHFQALLDVARVSLPIARMPVRDWLDLPPGTRAASFDSADVRATAALLVLEEAALRRAELRAMDGLRRELARPADPKTRGLRAETDEALRLAARLSRPAGLSPESGYGVPQAGERDRITRVLDRDAREWRDRGTALRRSAESALPMAERMRLDGVRRNTERLGRRMRELAAASAAPG